MTSRRVIFNEIIKLEHKVMYIRNSAIGSTSHIGMDIVISDKSKSILKRLRKMHDWIAFHLLTPYIEQRYMESINTTLTRIVNEIIEYGNMFNK